MTVTSPNIKHKLGAPNLERYSWIFMRVSGLIMFVTVVFHLLYMHMVVTVEKITFDNIIDRWSGPWGPVWKLFDISLLLLGMLHGYNGVRWVIDDYVHHKGWNAFLRYTLYVVGGILILGGMQVIFQVQGT